MDELALDVTHIIPWFTHEQDSPYVMIRVSEEHAAQWIKDLCIPLRRCYITDDLLDRRSTGTGHPKSEVLASKLPDRGSTMAGDFGEILVFLYHAVQEQPTAIVGPKKWRLKQDRTKPAPYSDVVHFVLPSWPHASENDKILCSEVKTKSTVGKWAPISAAIADCNKDRTSRLAKTLVWLRERALGEDLGTITVGHLDRFIKATDHPTAQKCFRAVAVICSSLVDDELVDTPDEPPEDHTVVVIAVPNLKHTYEELYDGVKASVDIDGDER